MGWNMKADVNAGSGFVSEWLLINEADGGHNSLLAWDCHSAGQFSHHNHPHALKHCAFLCEEFKTICL